MLLSGNEQKGASKDTKPDLRHPGRRHIPKSDDVPHVTKGFPWLASGNRMWLVMAEREEMQTDTGIIIPVVESTSVSLGKDKGRTHGLIASMGPGEFTVNGQYVSPYHDFGLRLGDIVFVEPNTGVVVGDGQWDYRIIAPYDIVGVMRRDIETEVRQAMMTKLGNVTRYYAKNPNAAIAMHRKDPTVGVGRPSYETGMEEAVEDAKRARGKATKTTMPADPKLPSIVKGA